MGSVVAVGQLALPSETEAVPRTVPSMFLKVTVPVASVGRPLAVSAAEVLNFV